MRNKKIGQIILKGGTIEELRKEFPDFPTEVTTEYFTSLGYTESTAKSYVRLLKKNTKETQNGVNTTVNSPEEINVTHSSTANILVSEYANYDNILVDTCSFAFKECIQIIEQSKQVTFIFSTLEEMDKKQYQKFWEKKIGKITHHQAEYFAFNIRQYTSKILENPDKFMLSEFSGYPGSNYVDNVLLQYLKILPRQIRPTLLTADKNLAVKAESLGLEYIIKMPNTNSELGNNTPDSSNTIDKSSLTLVKKYACGIKLFTANSEFYIYCPNTQKLYITQNGKEILYDRGTFFPIKNGDEICMHIKNKNNISYYKKTIQI